MTQLDVSVWERKSFSVKAVLLTDDNLDLVAEWCGGEVNTVQGTTIVQFIDCRRAPRPKRTSARVGEWITAEMVDDETVWAKTTSFKVYKPERFLATYEPQVVKAEVDPDLKKALISLFMESSKAQHLATLSGDEYGADEFHSSVISRILELFEPKVGLTFEQKRDKARTIARRHISMASGEPMATARRIADAILEEVCG